MDKESIEYFAAALDEKRERNLDTEAYIRSIRAQLKAMGFGGDYGPWMELETNSGVNIWFPAEFASPEDRATRGKLHKPGLWAADNGKSWEELLAGEAVYFDDPITAATWLLIESANA